MAAFVHFIYRLMKLPRLLSVVWPELPKEFQLCGKPALGPNFAPCIHFHANKPMVGCLDFGSRVASGLFRCFYFYFFFHGFFSAVYLGTWSAVWIEVLGTHRLNFVLALLIWSEGIAMLVSLPFSGTINFLLSFHKFTLLQDSALHSFQYNWMCLFG